MSMLMVLKFRLHLFLDKRGLNGWNSSKLRLSKPRCTVYTLYQHLSQPLHKTEPVTAEAEETVYSVHTYCTVRQFIWWLYCLALCDEMFDPFPLFDETWRNPPNLWLRIQTYSTEYSIPMKSFAEMLGTACFMLENPGNGLLDFAFNRRYFMSFCRILSTL